MTLPSGIGGATTEEVGYFEVAATGLAEWIVGGFDAGWRSCPANVASVDEVVALLRPPGPDVSQYVCAPAGRWTVLLSNGPSGTDVGVLPSYAARELGCRAMRVVSVDDTSSYPARVLEVYGPSGAPPLSIERSVVAANDGGSWVFETSGDAFSFEDQSAYARRSKAKRFTTDMLFGYLRALNVPVDAEPDWRNALTVQRTP